jgi:hypothetical protein
MADPVPMSTAEQPGAGAGLRGWRRFSGGWMGGDPLRRTHRKGRRQNTRGDFKEPGMAAVTDATQEAQGGVSRRTMARPSIWSALLLVRCGSSGCRFERW